MTTTATRPSPAAPRPWAFPAVRRDRLGNGLAVRSVHLPAQHLASARLVFPSGAAAEPAGCHGITTICARALLHGTAGRDADGFAAAVESLGAALDVDVSWDAWSVALRAPTDRLVPALGLLAEAVADPAFPAEAVELARRQRRNALVREEADAGARALRLLMRERYGADSRYAHPLAGDAASVAALDRDRVARWYAERAAPAAATLTLAGDLAGVDVPDVAERALGHWPATTTAGRTGREPLGIPRLGYEAGGSPGSGPRVVVADQPGAVQSTVVLGLVTPPRSDPAHAALSLAASCLAGTTEARLSRRLRDDAGYTYQAAGALDSRREGGFWSAYFSCDTDVTAAAVGLAVGELRDLRDHGPAAGELEAVRGYRVGVLPLQLHTAPDLAAIVEQAVVLDLADDEPARLRAALAACTADDVRTAAARWLDPDELVVAVAGDATRIVASLERAGVGPVTRVE